MKTIANFRSLSGTNREGLRLKENLIFRSGELNEINEEELKIITCELNIDTVIDLRGKRDLKGSEAALVKHWFHLDILQEIHKNMKKGTSLTELAATAENGHAAHEFMAQIYLDILKDEHALTEYSKFYDLLLDSENGVLFHCFAGKDRTGLAAFFVYKALDFDDEIIYEDFLLTNESRKEANRKKIAQLISQRGFNGKQVENMAILLNVDESYLKNAQAFMVEKSGTVANFLKEQLGLTDEKKARLKEKYLTTSV